MTCPPQKPTDALKTIWDTCEPFYGGTCPVPEYQLSLYYARPESDAHSCIHLLKAEGEDLAALYTACKPAEFGRNKETVYDDTYRKAKKMDLDTFSTPFDPVNLGILEQASRGLFIKQPGITQLELYKLNVYAKGDFFKPHQDTPRSENMVGSLVVVLPARHGGGQLVLRQGTKEWTLDFATKLAEATDPLVCFAAFFGDVEHEVLPVTSGYRVTLTYNIYSEPSQPRGTNIPTPFHDRLKNALVELINDKSTLPDGGFLGCGLVHKYVFNEDKDVNALLGRLRGADWILAQVCEDLGLRYSLTLIYRKLCGAGINLITPKKLASEDYFSYEDTADFLESALAGTNAEGVQIIGDQDRDVGRLADFVKPFYKDPVTKILEIRRMSSVNPETRWVYHGNDASLDLIYGAVSMLIAIDPVALRKEHVL